MTRKDYYLVAEAIGKCASLGQETLYYVADMVVTDLIADNPAVKRDLFLQTAGVTQETIDNAKI